MRTLIILLLAGALCTALTACGYKGPLKLPGDGAGSEQHDTERRKKD